MDLWQWVQDNADLIVTGLGGVLVGLATQVRKWWSDSDDDKREFRGQLLERVESLEGRCDTLQRQQLRMSQRIIELSQERDALRRQLHDVEKRADHAESLVEELRAKVESKNQEIHELQQRLRKLEDESHPEEI